MCVMMQTFLKRIEKNFCKLNKNIWKKKMAIDANGNITSYAVTETLGAQTQANGTNQVVMVDDKELKTGNGGNVVGTDYVGRVVILRRGTATEETRRVLTDTAGTGATRILTMSEDWVKKAQVAM